MTFYACRGLLEARRFAAGLALLLCCTAQAMPAKAPAARTPKEAKPSSTQSSEAVGFRIGPAPTWVKPLQPDLSVSLPPAPIHVLLIDRQTRLEPSGTVRYIHHLRQVNDSSGLQKAAQIEIEFDPSYQQLAIHQLDVWRGSQRIGKLDAKLIKLLHRETQLERQIVDGRKTASIVLDDLRVGDRVEWAASLVGDNPVFNGRYVDTEWSVGSTGPVSTLQLRLMAAPERRIQHRVGSPEVKVSSQVVAGWRETVFLRKGAPQFRWDPQLPAAEYLTDQIELSEFADWAEVAAWAEQLFAKAEQASEAVKARVADIRDRGKTPAEQLRLALDFVQRDIRYFGTEIGPDSHQPAVADQVLRQRFGDCKDKAGLLATLLHQLGLAATPALVSTQYREAVNQRLPSPLAFDHAIALVPLEGRPLWLDGTRAQQQGAPATRQAAGLGWALLARKDASALTAMPAMRDELRSERRDTFSFPRLAQDGQLAVETTYHGDLAEWLRDAKANLPAADFEKLVTGETHRLYNGLRTEGAPSLEEVPDRNAVTVKVNFRVKDFWRFPEQKTLVGDFALIDLMSPLRLPDQTPRTRPLRVAMPGLYRHSLRFVFGEEAFSQPSSNRFDESNEHFELHVRYEGQRQEQLVDGELRLTADEIAAAQWERYRQQLQKVWPRLGNSFSLGTITSAQTDELRKELATLEDRVRKNDLKLVTREQMQAHLKLALLTKQLAADRLPDKLRAEALVAQGMQFDHLGRPTEGRRAFELAQALDKTNAEVYAALAVNALAQRQDQDAVGYANRALEMAPANTAPRYTRAWARYFAGEAAQARDDLRDILKSRTEVERSYGAIWLYLATRRAGGNGEEAVRAYLPTSSKPAWPFPVLQWLAGQSSLETAVAATWDGDKPDRGRECELHFFASQKALLDNDLKQARSHLQKGLASGVVEFAEYAMAQRELDRIGKP